MTYTPPPAGQLSEQIDLPDHEMSLGLIHMEGAGIRVCTWDGQVLRHMSPARARRWSVELLEGPFGSAFAPVAQALQRLTDKAEEIAARVTAARARKFDAAPTNHWSSCAVHNEPALPAGPCDCGGYVEAVPVEGHA